MKFTWSIAFFKKKKKLPLAYLHPHIVVHVAAFVRIPLPKKAGKKSYPNLTCKTLAAVPGVDLWALLHGRGALAQFPSWLQAHQVDEVRQLLLSQGAIAQGRCCRWLEISTCSLNFFFIHGEHDLWAPRCKALSFSCSASTPSCSACTVMSPMFQIKLFVLSLVLILPMDALIWILSGPFFFVVWP